MNYENYVSKQLCPIYWYDGKLIESQTLELAIDDPGLLYGATVFTTLRVYGSSLNHRLTHWQAHCDRLISSVQAFGWCVPSTERLRQGAEILMKHFPVLRMTVFPDGREWITGRFLPKNLTEKQKKGIFAQMAATDIQRCLAGHKTGNYLSAWLAKVSVQQSDAEEAILVNSEGDWLETSTGNLWGWQNGCWWTPPLTAGILPGVVRRQLIDWLRQEKQEVREEPWTREVVRGFEAIAYTNSVVEIIPIHTVILPEGKLEYNPTHPNFQQLQMFFIAS